MISRFEAFNKNVADKEDMENKNKFVASLDIKSLFPSLKSEQCGKVVS